MRVNMLMFLVVVQLGGMTGCQKSDNRLVALDLKGNPSGAAPKAVSSSSTSGVIKENNALHSSGTTVGGVLTLPDTVSSLKVKYQKLAAFDYPGKSGIMYRLSLINTFEAATWAESILASPMQSTPGTVDRISEQMIRTSVIHVLTTFVRAGNAPVKAMLFTAVKAGDVPVKRVAIDAIYSVSTNRTKMRKQILEILPLSEQHLGYR